MLESPSHRESSKTAHVIWLLIGAGVPSFIAGWGIRENFVLKEMKEDPIRWVSKLPLEKQGELKKYLESFPDELTPQTVLPEVKTVDKEEKPQ